MNAPALQSVMTTEKPYEIFYDGIFFRGDKRDGLRITNHSLRAAEEAVSICGALNHAYQSGFTDGVKSRESLNTTQEIQ